MSQVSLIDVIGTYPEIPTRFNANIGFAIPIANTIEIYGNYTIAGSTPVHTEGVGNNITTYVQISQAIPSSNVNNVGLAAFNNNDFSVDENGFVSISGNILESLTPDTGGAVFAVGSNINVFGVKANTIPIIETHNISNDFYIENRNWETQYVVDRNSNVGLRGTFQNIQDAINQAVIDGNATVDGPAVIYIRNGNYVENITIGTSNYIHLTSFTPHPNANFSGVYINGSVDIGISANLTLSNLTISLSDSSITTNFTSTGLNIFNCYLFSDPGVSTIICDSGLSILNINDTYISGGIESTSLSVDSSPGYVSNSKIDGPCVFLNQSKLSFYQCSLISIDCSDESLVNLYNCQIENGITGNTTEICNVHNSVSFASGNFFDTNGSIEYSNCTIEEPGNLYNAAQTKIFTPNSQGNVIDSTTINADYSVLANDYYISITDTSSSRTITLPDPTTFGRDQTFIVQDTSGGAGTNNITINTNAGLINGLSSAKINTNYGCIKFKSDGTNYFMCSGTSVDTAQTITGNSGGAISPITSNWDIVTANSTPIFAGTSGTLTLDFGLTNLILGSSTSSLLTGDKNVGMGLNALQNITNGLGNTCIGQQAGQSITDCVHCTLIGYAAGLNFAGGAGFNGTTAIGSNALANWTGAGTTGTINNDAYGTAALGGLINGVFNLAIGKGSGSSYTSNESSNVIIKNVGVVGESNVIRIGTQGSDSGQQNQCFIAGIYGVSISSPQYVTIDSDGKLGSTANAGGGLTWNVISNTTQTASVNNGYIANNASLVTITLPANFAVGDIVRISGLGAGGWSLMANTGDVINFGIFATSAGGSLSSTNRYDVVEVLGVIANTTWIVLSNIGSLTVT